MTKSGADEAPKMEEPMKRRRAISLALATLILGCVGAPFAGAQTITAAP